jgi:hypothetical protein
MRFVWIGFLKEAARPIDPATQHQVSNFIGQPFIDVRSVGALRNAAGEREAMIMIFDMDSREAAEAYVATSPFRDAGLYAHYHLYEFADQVG